MPVMKTEPTAGIADTTIGTIICVAAELAVIAVQTTIATVKAIAMTVTNVLRTRCFALTAADVRIVM